MSQSKSLTTKPRAVIHYVCAQCGEPLQWRPVETKPGRIEGYCPCYVAGPQVETDAPAHVAAPSEVQNDA